MRNKINRSNLNFLTKSKRHFELFKTYLKKRCDTYVNHIERDSFEMFLNLQKATSLAKSFK